MKGMKILMSFFLFSLLGFSFYSSMCLYIHDDGVYVGVESSILVHCCGSLITSMSPMINPLICILVHIDF